MAVAASAGPLAVAAMGVFAAGVGGALVAKAVKKFRNASKSQGSIASQASSTLEQVGKQLQKSLKKDLGIADQEEKKLDLASLLSSISGGSKSSPAIDKTERDALTKELTAGVLKSLKIDTIEEKEKKLNKEITDLQGRFYGNLKKVMNDEKFCDSTNPSVIAETGEVLKKLLGKDGLKDDSAISTEAKALKDIMKDYDKKGLKERKLVLKTLNDIFDKCDDKEGDASGQAQAGKKKTELSNIITGSVTTDQTEKDKVTSLIKDKKGRFEAEKDDKKGKDKARQQQKKDLGMQK
jgi:hypothetical protein